MEHIRINVFSPISDEYSSAEIFIYDELWAIISGYDPDNAQIEFYVRTDGTPFPVAFSEVNAILQKAYDKLYYEVDYELLGRLMPDNESNEGV